MYTSWQPRPALWNCCGLPAVWHIYMCKNTPCTQCSASVPPVKPWLPAPGHGLAAQHLSTYHSLGLYNATHVQGCQHMYKSAHASTNSGVHASYDSGVLSWRQARYKRCHAHRPCGSSTAVAFRLAQSKLRYILWICRACSPLRQVGQRLVTLTEARKQESQNTCLRAQPSPLSPGPHTHTAGGAQVRRQRAPARPARHLRHRLQAYGALRVGLCRARRRLRRGKRQRQHPRPLCDGCHHVVLWRACRQVHHFQAHHLLHSAAGFSSGTGFRVLALHRQLNRPRTAAGCCCPFAEPLTSAVGLAGRSDRCRPAHDTPPC